MGRTRQYLRMKDGAEYEIVSEDTKYFYCGFTQFRKSNPNIETIGTGKKKRRGIGSEEYVVAGSDEMDDPEERSV